MAPSKQYADFLRQQRRRDWIIRGLQWLVLFLFLICWEVAARFHVINAMLTSRPSLIIESMPDFMDKGQLLYHVWITAKETMIGFVISMLVGTLVAISFWWFHSLARVMTPYMVVLNALPKVALGPIFYIWLGDRLSIYGMAIAISLIVTIIMIETAFHSITQEKMKLMNSLDATKWQMLFMVLLPASIPNIVATMRVNIGLTLVGVIMGEFLSAKAGLGFLIIYGGQVFQMTLVMTSIALLALLSLLLYGIVTLIGTWLKKHFHFI